MNLFKGYVPTKNKKCLMAFKNKTSEQLETYQQVKNLPEYAGILNDDVILIDIDDGEEANILYKICDDLNLVCRIYLTSRGMHFLFKNTIVETCKTHAKLACGLTADIKLGSRNSYSILKFNNKEREIIYDKFDDEEYQELPKWLIPVKSNIDFKNLTEGDGRNQSLFNYILTLQSAGFSAEEARECIHIINKYVLKESLDENELDVIIRDEAFQKPIFFEKNKFLFDKFAHFLISQLHLIKINGQLHMYRDGVYVDGYNQIEAEMIRYIPNLNRQRRNEVLAYLEICINKNTPVSPADYIAFKNGIYNVRTDEFKEFDPSIVITNKINYDYNLNAYNENVDKTLNKLACNDKEIRLLLEEVVGYCFYRRNELRKSFILIGDKANGKSTFLDMIKTLLGDENTSALDLKELGNRFKTAELFGKLANIGDDIGDEFIADASIFKKLVSGDRLNAERKGRDPFDFDPYIKLLFSANNIPRIKDKSGAVLDRLIIIPFDATFSKKDPDFDPYIKYKLRSVSAMEYLLILGIKGLKRVVIKNKGFTSNARVEAELKEYEENNNPIIGFFNEISENEIVNKIVGEVYKRYEVYCAENGFTKLTNGEFSKKLKKYFGLDIKRTRIDKKQYRIYVKNS